MVQLLPLAHHAHVAVVAQHQLHRRAVLHRRRQLLDVHQHRGVAAHAHRERVGVADLRADGRGQPVAHGAGAARGEPVARAVEAQVLRGPHLVLAHVGRDDRVAARDGPLQRRHEVLRQDLFRRRREGQAVFGAPALDARPPRRQPLGRKRFGQQPQQRFHDGAAVAHHRHVDVHHLVDAAGVDVDVDLAGVRTELVELARHAVVETRAHAHHQVGLVHREVGFEHAVHAQHADELRVGRGERAQPHQRERARRVQPVHELRERLAGRRPRVDEPAAAVEHRPARGRDQVGGALQHRPRRQRRAARAQRAQRGRRGAVREAHELDVLRHVEQHRAGAAGGGDVERAAHQRGHVVGRAHLPVPLGHRARHAQRIAFLESLRADHRRRHLPADAQHRHRIAHRVEQPRDRVAHARPRGDQHHADAARAARIALGRMHRRLFVAHQHMAQPGFAVQRVVQRQRRAAGVAEDRVDAALDQRVEQRFGAVAHAGWGLGHGRREGGRGCGGKVEQSHAVNSSALEAEFASFFWLFKLET
ncbi:hypothetical protein D3C71_1134040 [compost metagenome]